MANYLTTSQAAERLGVGPQVIRNLIRSGRLPALRLEKDFRILDADLQALAEPPGARP